MIKTLVSLAVAFIGLEFSPHAPAATAQTESAKLVHVAQRYFDEKMALDPLNASATLGDARYEGKLAITIAPEEIAKSKALHQRIARELRQIAVDRLSDADKLTYTLLRDEVALALEGFAYPGHLMPIDQLGSVPVLVAELGNGEQFQPLKRVTDYENYLKRLARLPAWNAQAIANLREGIAKGYVLPKALVQSALVPLKALTETDFDKSAFSLAIRNMPTKFTERERDHLTRAYRAHFEHVLVPSMHRLVAFIEKEFLPRSRDSAGIDALPDGKAYYRYLVRFHTTTSMMPEDIHALGLKEVERIRGEMAKVQAHYKFEGSVTDFLKWHDAQPRFRPFTSGEEILDAYDVLHRQVATQLPTLFGRMPKAALEVRPVPALQRAGGGAYYTPPARDGTRPGVFYAWWLDPQKFNDSIMASLYLHEGQPGHHYQAALAQEMPLPAFRKYGWSTALGEGWALYAETLGRELGLYDDPNQYLGHLKLELFRAVRLVTDTGLHAKGWTREQTMRYMMETEGASETNARNATERYMAWPAQALAYKIGSLKIQELRERAQARLGARFALRDFHDLVLSEGIVPLRVLEDNVERWLRAQDARHSTSLPPKATRPAASGK